MGIERDTFLGFIDDLAADLDDHESSAEERAARQSLSRSHFDRLISATAGEPPAAFRRRILLERAAYRLVVDRDGVLHRRILVLGALESAGVPDLGNGDPRKWVVEAA